MGEKSGISWTDNTFNPWSGCTKVSPGCTNCYAETRSARFPNRLGGWGVGQPRKRTSAANWRLPIKWNKEAAEGRFVRCITCDHRWTLLDRSDVTGACPRCGSGAHTRDRPRVFCAALADWLDPEVPIEWLADLLVLIYQTPNLEWQLLTKRPENWRIRIEQALSYLDGIDEGEMYQNPCDSVAEWLRGKPPANVAVGTTVEDQKRANERIPLLLSIPAAIRFLSMEPLLEAVNLFSANRPGNGAYICDFSYKNTALGDLNWVIVGGESGPAARPFNLEWARSIVDACNKAGVAVFVKQMGDKPYKIIYDCEEAAGTPMSRQIPEPLDLRAHHGADPNEWPNDLRVQEFPPWPFLKETP